MTETQPSTHQSVKSESAGPTEQHRAQTPIDHILERLSPLELPAKEAVRALPAPQVAPEPQAEHAREFLHLGHALP